MYKNLGLNMRPTNAAFKDGGFALEAGIAEMESRFATGRLKVAQQLTEVFDEYVGYHKIDNLIHKVDDDLLSAIRVGLMDLRFAGAAAAGQTHSRHPAVRRSHRLPRTWTSMCGPARPTTNEGRRKKPPRPFTGR